MKHITAPVITALDGGESLPYGRKPEPQIRPGKKTREAGKARRTNG